MVIYILLLSSNHIQVSFMNAQLTLRQMTIINPIYTSKFPNNPKLVEIDDFKYIVNLSDDEKIKIRNKMHSCNPIVQSIIDDDINRLIQLLSKSQFNIDGKIPKSIFEIHDILNNALPIQYAAFLGSVNCFKYLLLQSNFVDYDKLLEYAITGGNWEIIHIVEENSESLNYNDYAFNQKLLNIAILYMHNDLVEYLLNNYEITINCDCYINCIYSSNYEALNIFLEYKESKNGINSIDEFHSYISFMSSILDIIGAEYIKSLKDDINFFAWCGKKFDILNFIIDQKLVNDDCKDILELLSLVLKYNEEQVIKAFHKFLYSIKYLSFYDDWYEDYWDYWDDYFDDSWDDEKDENNYLNKNKNRTNKKESNKNMVLKKH